MANRYLVTGGAGFIGSHLVDCLLKRGEIVRVVDNLSTGHISRLSEIREHVEFCEGDLADEQFTREAVQNIDCVLHQAAVPSVQRSVGDPIGTHRSNVTATLNLLEYSRAAGVRRFVYAASSSAYGDTEVLPKNEGMPPNPQSPYALQKLTGEYYCKLYYDLYGLETISLRYFNVFGPKQDPDSEYAAVIPKFIRLLLARQPVVVYGDGEQSRDFTYVANVVEANMLALEASGAAGKVYNIGCGERISLNALVRLLARIVGNNAEVKYEDSKPGDVRHSLADIGLARHFLHYEPKVKIEEGLKRTVNSFAKNCSCE